MKIDILTLFPDMFQGFLTESIIKRAIEDKLIEINIRNIRDYSDDPHKKVDDYQFGGGNGMILMPQPIFAAVDALKETDTVVIMMTPQGEKYHQDKAKSLSGHKHLIILCGHYEGFDERIRSIVDLEISIGDYILTGGELPSMILTDSVVRLVDGVITEQSHIQESFSDNLLDYPVYTKPKNFRGMEVPEVLFSGHHANVDKWRLEEQVKRTANRRPDLLEKR